MAHNPRKKIIVCCDGTGKRAYISNECLTNVSNIARCINSHYKQTNEKGIEERIPQIVYYQAGLGTVTWDITRQIRRLTGLEIYDKVLEAYVFICHNYEDHNDEIYLIGYSRGAFTVRCIAQLIRDIGLLQKGKLVDLPKLFDKWTRKEGSLPQDIAKLKDGTRCDIRIDACAVWDTVSSVGNRLNFVHSELCPNIVRALQAISIHEHRIDFRPVVWKLPSPEGNEADHNATLKQCWFPGYHGDIGGGREDDSLAHFPLIWMMANLEDTLSFNRHHLWDFVSKKSTWKITDTKNQFPFNLRSSFIRRPRCHFWDATGFQVMDPVVDTTSNETIHYFMYLILSHRPRILAHPPMLVGSIKKVPEESHDRQDRWEWDVEQANRRGTFRVSEEAMAPYELELFQHWLNRELELIQLHSKALDPRPETIIPQLKVIFESRRPL
ncbi:hypothetical protein BP6252_11003 [Coleophoma cylindrospora]|uniref:T6SS Phospholipase effector Tle1-like catalytic domain-containing protein n=1 Tax=Coleophoma cylindrospora TaxID=1849047 RepID=A0A3D8QP51_9HELO|nr:hypothetical protein BP6252_11003 [Coleophoma cylindrospora]